MTRFHIALIVAGLLSAAALVVGDVFLLGFAVGALLVVAGFGVAWPQMSFFGAFVCRGDSSRRRVALTFDDGPDARSTPALLDLLCAEKIEAAFFCIGKNVAANGELVARIAREGHLLGNHTFNHRNSTNFFTVARLREELAQTQTAIETATGVVPKFFRPPIGLSNPRVFRAAKSLNLQVIGWNARGLDTICSDPARIVARIARRLTPGGIILLHDGNLPAEHLVVTVKLLLLTLKTRGYEVVRLDKLLK